MIGGDHHFKPSRFNHCPDKHSAHTATKMPLECGITGVFIGWTEAKNWIARKSKLGSNPRFHAGQQSPM
jgi:hypothetical protein